MTSTARFAPLLALAAACGPPEPPAEPPEPAEPSETHFVVRSTLDQKPVDGVTVEVAGSDGRESHTPDPRGLVPRGSGPRHVEVHHESGHVLYRGDFPEGGVLEVPPPLEVRGALNAFGEQPRVLVGHHLSAPLSSYLRRKHDLRRPVTDIPPFEDEIPMEWVDATLGDGGSFASELVVSRGALAVVAMDADGAFGATDLDPSTATDGVLQVAAALAPVPVGSIEVTLPPDTSGEWAIRLEPAHDEDSPERRSAVLVHAADPEHGRLLTGRRAVPVSAAPVALERVPPGPWTLFLFQPPNDPSFQTRVEVTASQKTSWTPTAEELGSARPQTITSNLEISDFCKDPTNWSTTRQYTGVRDEVGIVPIIGLFAEDKSDLFYKTYSDQDGRRSQAWTVPNARMLRCKQTACKTTGTIQIISLPSWAVKNPAWVKGGQMFSPWLAGLSSPQAVREGDNYNFAAAINSGMQGTVVDRLKVYVFGSDNKPLPTGTPVTFGSPLDGSSPGSGAVGSDGYVLVPNASDVGPIYCANTPFSTMGGMSVTISYQDNDYEGGCLGYLNTSGSNACVMVELDAFGNVLCNQPGASCTP